MAGGSQTLVGQPARRVEKGRTSGEIRPKLILGEGVVVDKKVRSGLPFTPLLLNDPDSDSELINNVIARMAIDLDLAIS